MPPAEQIARLPKWARDHIRVLEMRRDEALAALNTRHVDTRVVVDPFADTARFVASDALIRFMVGEDPDAASDDWSQYLDARIVNPAPSTPYRQLSIRSGAPGLLVIPQASNSVTIRLDGRR